MTPTAIVPIRSFAGLTRLSSVLGEHERAVLMQHLASRTVLTAHSAGLPVFVVSNDAAVATWGEAHGCTTISETEGGGLNGAADAGANAAGGPWMIIHADLPTIDVDDVLAASLLVEHRYVLAPSHDGGTSLIGGTGSDFPFRYGPGSFRLHLAAVGGDATILIRPGLALDLDRPWDLSVLRRLGHL